MKMVKQEKVFGCTEGAEAQPVLTLNRRAGSSGYRRVPADGYLLSKYSTCVQMPERDCCSTRIDRRSSVL